MNPDQSATLALCEPSHKVSPAVLIELVLQRVRLRARRRLAWLDCLAGDANGYKASIASALDCRDTPENETAWQQSASAVQELNRELARVESALAGDAGLPLQHLGQLFSLSEAELDLLETCLAIAVDPALAAVFAHLQGQESRGYATDTLVARLFGHGRRPVWMPGGALAVWKLVADAEVGPGEPPPLTVDRVIPSWLTGNVQTDEELVGHVRLLEARKPLSTWPVQQAIQMIKRAYDLGGPFRIIVSGAPGSGRRNFAAAVAAELGLRVLAVDSTDLEDAVWQSAFIRAQRLASLANVALVWHGARLERSWPGHVFPGALQFVASAAGEVVGEFGTAANYIVQIPESTLEERHRLWRAAIPEACTWPANEALSLSARYRLTVGDIAAVGRRSPISAAQAAAAVRELTRNSLGDLGQLIDCSFTWDDLVVSDKNREALLDFVFEANERSKFWANNKALRLFPRGTGLLALFNGPPGTGKTMAAQIIAAELNLDLIRIDLSTVVSKYIGETAKHLGQVFRRAGRMNAILLFDEADALFGKRTEIKDAHDRYANTDTGFLLQQLEDFDGIAILASNKKHNIDPAFIRRLRYLFEFMQPDAADRDLIWHKVMRALLDQGDFKKVEKTLGALAETVELSGAQIKNAALASVFIARRQQHLPTIDCLLNGIERELKKDGRALTALDRSRLTAARQT